MTAIADLPDIRPSLLLDFANSGRVDPRIECTRASSATCWGPDGKLRTVPANTPRIDYDPATGKCLGLLVEEARTNLLRQSSLLSDTAWGKSDVLVTPSDTQNALGLGFIKLTPISGTYKTINQPLYMAISDNQIVTFSVFAKAGELNTIRLGVANKASSIITGHFNLLTGEASRQEITGKYLGDGWWRVTLSGTDMSSGSATPRVHIYSINNGDATTPGDGVSGLYIAAPQLELGAYATSYIPTAGTTATRAADSVGLDLPRGMHKGSAVLNETRIGSSSSGHTFPMFLGTDNTGFISDYIGAPYVRQGSTAATRSVYIKAEILGPESYSLTTGGAGNEYGVMHKTAISWAKGRLAINFNNGVTAFSEITEAELPLFRRLAFSRKFSSYDTSAAGATVIHRLYLYSTVVSDTQLKRLTA
ncbi:phage head spike fiber domain-containing protein [Comamonas kerstersii]|uniref:phage head spike fiber domain-containing protein n=1 Tax=Comamonas kerstersii TaxID=225992 RepID=UPI001B31DCC3|nr:hypothetical protein [Comamonas kerstersii]QTW18077.1 hypothetical protein H8N02_12805 [Comamonas kerstersii]